MRARSDAYAGSNCFSDSLASSFILLSTFTILRCKLPLLKTSPSYPVLRLVFITTSYVRVFNLVKGRLFASFRPQVAFALAVIDSEQRGS